MDEGRLERAEAVIAEHGFEALEAGGDASRWDLFAALIERDEQHFNSVIDAALEASESPAEALVGLIEACVTDYDWSYWIELWSLCLRDERARALRNELDSQFRARIADLVERGRAEGGFEVDDVAGTTLAIASLIDALAVEVTLGDDTVSPNFMLRATTAAASRLIGADLHLRPRSEDGS